MHAAGNLLNESSKRKTSIFEWVFATPTAIQVTSQFFGGFIAPGMLGIFLKYWQNITREFWYWISNLVSFHVDGIESIFDLFTLAFLMLLTALGAKLRKKLDATTDLQIEFRSSTQKMKRLVALRAALLIFCFISIFSISEISIYLHGSSNFYSALLVFYIVSIIYIYLSVEYYFGFPYEGIATQIDHDRVEKRHSAIFVLAFPGLFLEASWLATISVFLYISIVPSSIGQFVSLLVKFWLLSFFIRWLSHIKFNWPTSETIMGNTKLFFNFLFLAGIVIIPLSPFYLNIIGTENSETGKAFMPLIFFGAFLSMVGFAFVLKFNWKIPRNFLIIAFFFITVDFVLSYVTSIVQSAGAGH